MLPVQPPEAEQLVASADDQVSCELPPLVTLVGFAVSATVGTGGGGGGVDEPMFTVSEPRDLPPAPEHVMLKVVGLRRLLIVCVPDTGLSPLQPPEATQAVAFVEDQLSCVLAPLVTCIGFALNVVVGGGQLPDVHFGSGALTATVALSVDVPPLPVQVSVKVVVTASRGVCSLP